MVQVRQILGVTIEPHGGIVEIAQYQLGRRLYAAAQGSVRW
jgi:hypothetical protein